MFKILKFSIVYATVFVLFSAVGTFAQTARTEAVKIGEVAPDFTLTDNNGNQIILSEKLKTAPVVLVFYRGSWCPFCIRQLANLREFANSGEKARLFAISIDSAETSNNLIKKIEKDGKGKVDFAFLSDAGAKTIDAYGLRDPRYANEEVNGIPYPSVYVIDTQRKVVWSKIETNYKNRPTNAEIRAAVDKLISAEK